MIYLGTSLVWRKSKISMQEDREVQGKSTIRLIPNIVYYYGVLSDVHGVRVEGFASPNQVRLAFFDATPDLVEGNDPPDDSVG